MTGHFSSPVFAWLLMTASVALTSGQTSDPAPLTTAPLSSTEETTGTPTRVSEVFSTDTQTSNTPGDGPSPPMSTSVRTTAPEMTTLGQSTAVTATATARGSTKLTAATQTPSDSTPSQETATTSTAGLEPSEASTRPTLSTEIGSTATVASTAGEDASESTTRVSGGGGGSSAAQPTASRRTSTAVLRTTKATKRPGRPGGGTKPNAGTNPGYAVAGLIGGALVLMMVGFVFIYYKKRKLQQQKTTTTDWAGPSPFLDGGANGQASRQSSNRISLSSFLPQRMSKRLSLLPESEEELQDMTPATFGGKHLEGSAGPKANGNGAPGINGSAAVDPEPKPAAGPKERQENSAPSPQTGNSPTTKNNSNGSEVDDNSADRPSDAAEAAENATVQTVSELGGT